MKKSLALAIIAMGLMSAVAYAGNQYNWGTNTGANWVTPDNTNIQTGQALVIGSTTPYPQVTTSSTSAVGLGVFTIAQINALTPNMVGQIVFCSNCTNTPVCVSTAALIQSFASITTSTSGVRNDCR